MFDDATQELVTPPYIDVGCARTNSTTGRHWLHKGPLIDKFDLGLPATHFSPDISTLSCLILSMRPSESRLAKMIYRNNCT